MTLYSIGHSNATIQFFIDLLQAKDIQILVDTRSQPYSRYLPHFAQNALRRSIEDAGIQYVYLGDKIGGRPEGSEFYFESGKVDYDRVARSKPYREGIEKLIELGRDRRAAFMCAEADYHNCHRYKLISRTLVEQGIEVKQILHTGKVVTSEVSEFVPEQPSLF